VATGGPNPTRLYTRTGDGGETGLAGGARIAKDSPRIRAFGTLDELGATLGVAEGLLPGSPDPLRELLVRLQHEVFLAQAEVATAPGTPLPAHRIEARHVARLEGELDRYTASIGPLRSFVLPRRRRPRSTSAGPWPAGRSERSGNCIARNRCPRR